MDYAILVKCSITNKNAEQIVKFAEDIKNGTYGSTTAFDSWTNHFRRGKGRNSWHSVNTSETVATRHDDGMDVGKRGSRYAEYSEKDSRNSKNESSYVESTSGAEQKDTKKFSLAAPIEETKTLIARHNFTAEKMWKTLKLGGWPSPSIAITKANMGQRAITMQFGAWETVLRNHLFNYMEGVL